MAFFSSLQRTYVRSVATLIGAARWRRRRPLRLTTPDCPLCGPMLGAQVEELLASGFYHAAVTASRLQLELLAIDYHRLVLERIHGRQLRRGERSFFRVIGLLRHLGEIDREKYRQLRRVYHAASLVVHGRPYSRASARRIVRDVAAAIAALRGAEKSFGETSRMSPRVATAASL